MRLGQGSQRRSPWWCWAVMLLAVAVTLPGAALVGAADEKAEEATDAETSAVKSVLPVDNQTQSSDRTYHVDDILTKICSDPHVTREVARDTLLSELPRITPGIRWSGEDLVAHCTEAGHSHIATILEAIRTRGSYTILIHATIVEGPPELIDAVFTGRTALSIDLSPYQSPEELFRGTERPFPENQATQHARAHSVVRKVLPVILKISDERCAAEVLARLQKDRRLKTLARPSIATLNRQNAYVTIGGETPFVAGMKDGAPQVRCVNEGMKMQLYPQLMGQKRVRLDCRLTLSSIRDVETMPAYGSASAEPVKLQLPEVESTEVDTSVELAFGQTLLIGGLKRRDDNGETQSVLIMLNVEKAAPMDPSIDVSKRQPAIPPRMTSAGPYSKAATGGRAR